MISGVPFYRHQLGEVERGAISGALEQEILTSGKLGKSIEAQMCTFFEVKHSKLVNSWTNGYLALLLALKVGPGDEVIVPSMTFIACANMVELLGAKVVFCDVDPETLLVSIENVKPLVTPKTKAVIAVHLYGQMVNTKDLFLFCQERSIKLIEDAAHSFESTFDDYRPGRYSDCAIFSFYATKNITCGEGGLVISNDSELMEILNQTVLHGMTAGAADRFNQGVYRHWDMQRLGVKANLPDMLASLLPSQVIGAYQKLDMRLKLVDTYDKFFESSSVIRPKRHNRGIHAHHLYPLWVPPGKRDSILQILGENRIGATVNFRPVHEMSFYREKYKAESKQLTVSSNWGAGVLSIPLYPTLSNEEQEYVIEIFARKVLPELSE
jgi:dTDP-4-amino-4,6-dideoxygalactose transaminase